MIISVWTDMFLHKYLVRIDDPDQPIQGIYQSIRNDPRFTPEQIHYYSIDQNQFLNPALSASENMIGIHEQILMVTPSDLKEYGLHPSF